MSQTGKILDHPVVSQRYFFPRKESFDNPFWVDCRGVKLACYYHRRLQQAKTVVFFHGNGEVVADYIDFFVPIFDQLGLNCLLAEYRGYGMSTGSPGLASMLDDVKDVINTLDPPPSELVFFGRSVGTIYAVHAASLFPGAAGLILESGIADVCERLLLRMHPEELGITLEQMQAEVTTHFNTREKLGKYRGRTLVMHTQNDSLVDVDNGRRLYEWAPEPRALKIFPEGDHNDIFSVNAREYVSQLKDFMDSLP